MRQASSSERAASSAELDPRDGPIATLVPEAHDDDDAAAILVRDERELGEMRDHLVLSERVHPVIGLAPSPVDAAPFAAPSLVRAIVGQSSRIYVVTDEPLRALERSLGRRLALQPGSARIWWPGLTVRSDPEDHPLVLALDGESEADTLAELAHQFDLSRPHVRRELKLSDDARALAEHLLCEAEKRERESAQRLREAHRERHREAMRAEAADAALQETRLRLQALMAADHSG